jgi:hypothetical protein
MRQHDIMLCDRVKKYARWYERKVGPAPFVADMPARYRLWIDNITPYSMRAFSKCTAEQLADYMRGVGPKPLHIPLTADSDQEAAAELAWRAGKAGGDGRGGGGGLRARFR